MADRVNLPRSYLAYLLGRHRQSAKELLGRHPQSAKELLGIPNKKYRSCSEAGALGEKTFQRYGLQSEETNTERPLVQFSHRLYLMLNSVLVVAISDSSTSTEVSDLQSLQQRFS